MYHKATTVLLQKIDNDPAGIVLDATMQNDHVAEFPERKSFYQKHPMANTVKGAQNSTGKVRHIVQNQGVSVSHFC